jgi:hypothetical protein
MRQSLLIYGVLVTVAVFAFFFGCEKTFIGPAEQNRIPEVWLSSGPVEGDTTGYQVHFYWGGWDPDGEVKCYEFVVADGDPYGFNQEDTTGLEKWTQTSLHDSIFRVSADDTFRQVTINNNLYTRYDKTHTFFIRSVDKGGRRSEAVHRSFTAWTLAPEVQITMPRPPAIVDNLQQLGKIINFEWRGVDPIDSPDNTQDPDSIRYMYHRVDSPGFGYYPSFNIVSDLNRNPWRYEEDWSPWIYYRAPGDSGRSTYLGDDEILETRKSHIFAVQAKDDAGAVTAIFSRRSNVRQFIVSETAAPFLTITEPFLGGFKFIGTNLRAEPRYLPPGVALRFKFYGDSSNYGGEVVCFQYGWDVADLSNPNDWDSDCSPFILGCTATWYSGVHTLFVRVVDNSGVETLGQVEINIVPFTMDRNLLWVDDFPSDNSFTQTMYALPREDEHDALWLGHCGRAIDFDPGRDVYDAKASYNFAPPDIKLIGRYKNIIWTYSSASYSSSCWDNVVAFTPESQYTAGSQLTVNYLAIFLTKGGHLLTEGNSESAGGLAAALPQLAQSFPMNIRCEITENQDGCEGDTSGVNSFPYKDYCVTMIDKVVGMLRDDPDMPWRRVRNYDCMYPYALNLHDAWNDSVPGMPDTLNLWSEITKLGRFFYPLAAEPYPGGFTLVEVYNPAYWMTHTATTAQSCFHPLFKMKAKNSLSPLNDQAIALWVTKYSHVKPDVASGISVAAPSLHLGFELWYFNRTQGTRIVDAMFRKWQILATP